MATPGASVGNNALISPGGAQGPAGSSAWTLTTASFVVPAIGSTVTVNVQSTSWAVVGEFVWVAQAGGSTSSPMALQITALTSTSLTLLNPPTAGTSPSGDAGNLITTGSDSLLYLPPSALNPQIWLQRLRSYNAIGNPNFEIDQVNVGNQINVGPGTGSKLMDRWQMNNSLAAGGPNFFGQQSAVNSVVPGTNYLISSKAVVLTFAVQKASLVAADIAYLQQSIEGPMFRELVNDVTSFSILASTNVTGGLKFTVAIRDAAGANSLVLLCTIPTANTPTLLTFPNIPKPGSGTWSVAPGVAGALLTICAAAGSTYTAPSASPIWQSGNFVGAPGMDNFFSKAINSTLTISALQWEPGPLCTTLQDKPWSQNYDEVQRYYCKSWDYGTKPGTQTDAGGTSGPVNATYVVGGVRFPKKMATTPTVVPYAPRGGGAANAVFLLNNGTQYGISSVVSATAGVEYMTLSGTPGVAGDWAIWHYTSDTGW